MKIGTANYDSKKSSRTYFKIKEGNNIYRILPPMGELADRGRWSMYHTVNFGYYDTKGKMKPFIDCRVVNSQTKMVEIESAAYLKAKELEKAFNEVTEQFKLGKATRQDVEKASDEKFQFNQDSKHYLNVIDLEGQIGLLKIPHRMMQELQIEITKLRDRGIDPTSVDNGRFFNFFRSGIGRDTIHKVNVYEKEIEVENVGRVKQEVVHKLTEDIINRLESEAFELNKIFLKPTAEEVERIVSEGSVAVDAIFYKDKPNNAPATQPAAVAPTPATPPAAVAPTPTTPPAAPVEAPKAAPVEAPPAAPKVEQPAKPLSEQSDEEFLKSLNI